MLKRLTSDQKNSITINLPLNEPKTDKKISIPNFMIKSRLFTFLKFWSSDFYPKSNLKFKFIQLRSRLISNKIYKSIEWSHQVFLQNKFLWAFSVIVFLHFPIFIWEFDGLIECQFDSGYIMRPAEWKWFFMITIFKWPNMFKKLFKNHKFTNISSHSKSNKKVSFLPRLIVCQIIMKISVCLRKFFSWKEIYCDYIQIMIFIFHRIKKNFLKRQSVKRSNFSPQGVEFRPIFIKILRMISWKIFSGFLMALWLMM